VKLGLSGGGFILDADVSFANDGKYPSQRFMLGHYFDVNDCVVGFEEGTVSLRAGRGAMGEEIEGPYSLFISSERIPALFADMAWELGMFKYETRWMALNWNSLAHYEETPLDFIDRGMNYKAYSFKVGDLEFGYQDSSIYLGEVFDAEAFVSPLPAFVQQMILSSTGRPYSQKANTNSLMGIFGILELDRVTVSGQFLLDDINATFLAPILGWLVPALNDINNLQKFAWNASVSIDTPYGLLSFHHAGATKYTFESTYTKETSPAGFGFDVPDYANLPYPYYFFPITRYTSGGVLREARIEENCIGYLHGENNLSFMIGWEGGPFTGTAWGIDCDAALEYTVSGSKSPANPWHEYDDWRDIGKSFALLDEDDLEHDLVLSAGARKTFGRWKAVVGCELGWIWNPLEPTQVTGHPDEAWIWKPAKGKSSLIAGASLGFVYRLE